MLVDDGSKVTTRMRVKEKVKEHVAVWRGG